MSKQKILVVDDEDTLCQALKFNIEMEGYRVDTAHSAEEALGLPLAKYELILLDVMMEGMDGFELAAQLKSRADTCRIPIIFLTAKDAEDDMVRGLDLGADDYIRKPFSLRNVLARVRAVLRRGEQEVHHSGDELTFRGLSIDRELKQVSVDGQRVKMPRKEYEILLLLLTNPGRVFSREQILKQVWGDGVLVVDRTVDVNVTRIRQKLGPYGENIVTRSGYGYAFVE